jgi:hypothetical protein
MYFAPLNDAMATEIVNIFIKIFPDSTVGNIIDTADVMPQHPDATTVKIAQKLSVVKRKTK